MAEVLRSYQLYGMGWTIPIRPKRAKGLSGGFEGDAGLALPDASAFIVCNEWKHPALLTLCLLGSAHIGAVI